MTFRYIVVALRIQNPNVFDFSIVYVKATVVGLILSILLAIGNYLPYNLLRPDLVPVNSHRGPLLSSYDFIVVGSGSAGAVVANRLSEINEWNVLLLEAGGEENLISDIPILAAYLQLTKMDWQFKTEPQPNACRAMKNARCSWPSGKVVGGSSVLNYMLYVRGNKKDYDNWESLGNTGWGSREALYYFKKSEDNRNPYLASSPCHSTGGYLTVSESPFHTPLINSFLEGGKQLGYDVRDVTGQYQTGFATAQGTIRGGSRCSTAKAFLQAAQFRTNLHILLCSHVTRVHIDPKSKLTIGVEFFQGGMLNRVRVQKEVVLSAGAINSPQILMLSGIGPKRDLDQINIPVLQDLRVGNNLQDHIGLGGLTFSVKQRISLAQWSVLAIGPLTMYSRFGKGPLTSFGGIEGLAFVSSKYANASDDFPDIQFQFLAGSTHSDAPTRQLKAAQGLTDDFYYKTFKQIEYQDAWSLIPILLRPKSKGFLKLRSKNPFDPPLIYPKYFEDDFDMQTLIEGVKMAVELSRTPALQAHGSRFLKFPDCSPHVPHSDEYYRCMINMYSITIYHYSGTCKMGPYWDPEAVVDPQLRVYGIKGLRVIDASIMPNLVSGNTHAPTIMIGEKGSDLIKEYWMNITGYKVDHYGPTDVDPHWAS